MKSTTNASADWWRFLREFVSAPGLVGAVAPSSGALARSMVAWADLGRARAVVEYGAGTGIFTGHILSRLPEGCRFFAVEVNPRLADVLRERHPSVAVHVDSAKNVRELCAREGIEAVDCIISGLPWACFPEKDQAELLDGVLSVLRRGGEFVTFAYVHGLLLPGGRRFRKRLGRYFPHVSRSSVVWWNLPPAFVYQCRK